MALAGKRLDALAGLADEPVKVQAMSCHTHGLWIRSDENATCSCAPCSFRIMSLDETPLVSRKPNPNSSLTTTALALRSVPRSRDESKTKPQNSERPSSEAEERREETIWRQVGQKEWARLWIFEPRTLEWHGTLPPRRDKQTRAPFRGREGEMGYFISFIVLLLVLRMGVSAEDWMWRRNYANRRNPTVEAGSEVDGDCSWVSLYFERRHTCRLPGMPRLILIILPSSLSYASSLLL